MKTIKKPQPNTERKIKDQYSAEYGALMSRQNTYISLIYTSQFLILTYLSLIFTLADKKAFSYTEEMASALFLGYNIIYYIGITIRHKYFQIGYYIKNFLLNEDHHGNQTNFYTYKYFAPTKKRSLKIFFRLLEDAISSVVYSYYLIAPCFYLAILYYAIFHGHSISIFYYVNIVTTFFIMIVIAKISKLTDDIRFL